MQLSTSSDRQARPIGTLVGASPSDGNELLCDRFLCRGGGLLLVGQSGQGKSSADMQMAILWSLGRECFGIRPRRALKVLIVQAENDDADLQEMFSGICKGLRLTEEEMRLAGERVLFYTEDARSGRDLLDNVLTPLLEEHRPDLLILDPALAYVPGDTKDAQVVGDFLRRGLNPILHRFNCGVLIVHHTTKQKAEGQQVTHDFLYAGAGSIEWSNWARAVLVLETRGKGCYRLHAPKRGTRLGWADEAGNPICDRFIRHSKMPGSICWHEVDAAEVESVARSGKSKLDLLPHVPLSGAIPQTVLLDKANASGIGQKKARAFLDELIADGRLYLWLVPRPGTNPEKRVSREPQPEAEVVK